MLSVCSNLISIVDRESLEVVRNSLRLQSYYSNNRSLRDGEECFFVELAHTILTQPPSVSTLDSMSKLTDHSL